MKIKTTWHHPESNTAYTVQAEITGKKVRIVEIIMGFVFFKPWQFSEIELLLIEQAVREAAQNQTV